MKRSLYILLALMLCTVFTGAQTVPPGHFNPRWSCPSSICSPNAPPTPPVVTVTVPTAQPTFTSSTSTMSLSGTVVHNRAVNVTWSNNRGGSGTATGTTNWSVAAAASPTRIFYDDFTSAANVDVTTRPPNTGEGWHEVYNTAGHATTYCRNRATGGYLYPIADANNNTLVCLANPSQALSGASYDLSVKLNGNPGLDDPEGFIFGADTNTNPALWDSHNYCGVQWYNFSANPDVIFWKKSNATGSDVYTLLGTHNSGSNPTVNDVMSVQMRNGAVEVFQAGVSIIGPITDTFCSSKLGVGVIFGASTTSTDDVTTLQLLDEFTVVDQSASVGGISLSTGANIITVTACDDLMNCGTDVITVNYGASGDSTNPTALITSPTAGQNYTTSTAALSLGGSATDNTGVSSVTWACDHCSVTSGTATCATCSSTTLNVTWSASLTLGCSSGAGTGNAIVATAHDAAGNPGSSTTLNATCATSDVTPPTTTISTPVGVATGGTGSYTAPSNTVTVTGGSNDNVGVQSIQITCAACVTVGNVTGLNPWNVTLTLTNGLQRLVAKATDLSGTVSSATNLDITYNQALTITTNALPGGTVSSPYVNGNGAPLAASGGTAPYTWVNNASGTSSLASGGAACGGLTVSSAGLISGTPTTTGTCTITYKVTDAAPTSLTVTLSIVVSNASTGVHAFFDAMVAGPYFWKGFSLRPVGGAPITSVNYASQLLRTTTTHGYNSASAKGRVTDDNDASWITYDFTHDTDAHRQDAAKIIIKPFFIVSGATAGVPFTLAANVTDTTSTTISVHGATSTIANQTREIEIGSEIMTTTDPFLPCCTDPMTFTVVRNAKGSTAATHTNGDRILVGGSSLPSVELKLPICPPIFTGSEGTACDVSKLGTNPTEFMQDGHTYLFIWDLYYVQDATVGGFLNTGLSGHKTVTFHDAGSKWLETRGRYDGGDDIDTASGVFYGIHTKPPTWNPLNDVAAVDIRSYETPCTATGFICTSTWSDTDAHTHGIGVTDSANPALGPTATAPAYQTIKPNRWVRWYVLIDMRANDFDPVTTWVSTEDADPVMIYDHQPWSITDAPYLAPGPMNGKLTTLNIEFNTSTQTCANRCLRNLIVYARNFVFLKDVPTTTAALTSAGILTRPVGSN